MTTIEENICDYNNKIADDLFYGKGINIFPQDADKVTYVEWSKYKQDPVLDETHEDWKANGRYSKGILSMPGKVFRSEYQGFYYIGIDLDSETGIREFCNIFGVTSIDDLKDRFTIEQHDKNPDGSHPDSYHVYFYSQITFTDLKSNDIGIEIYSNCNHLICCTPSYHSETNSRWRIIGTNSPEILTVEQATKLMNDVDKICQKHNVKYLNQFNGSNNFGNGYYNNGNGHNDGRYNNSDSILTDELRQISHSLKIPPEPGSQHMIKEGMRHDMLVALANSLLFYHKPNINKNISYDQLKDFLFEANEKLCEIKYPENDLNKIWTDVLEYYSRNASDDNDNNNNNNDSNKYASNIKASILIQIKPEIIKELQKQICWSVISLSPLTLLIAHSDHKNIIYGSVRKYKLDETSIQYFNLSKIVIRAIPEKIILNKDLLGLSDNNHKYTIEFITESNEILTVGPKTLDEIATYLKDRALTKMSLPKVAEALGIIIGEFESDKKLIVEEDIETPGFYFIDGKIRLYHVDLPANPTIDQIKSCCELLDILQVKFKKKDVLPTILKWSIMAPFDYVLKQIHQKWMKWIYAYGWSNTGKSSLGEKICCCIHDRYDDDKKRKESIIPFTAADTVARLGVSLSRNTYPIVVNEVSQLSDEYKSKALVEMIKTTVTDETAREKYVNKVNWTRFPALSACILTSNSAPPRDIGFKRRIIPIEFTQKDQYSADEMKELDTLFDQRMKHELKYLGNFAINYILENQQKLIIEKYEDWKITAETVLTKFYESAGKKAPEWIKYFVEEKQLEDSKEDIDLLFRSFFIIKINETYNKFHGNIQNLKANIDDVPFDFRLEFCLNKNLIPFLNPIKVKDGPILIAITSDILSELKQKIPEISSLPEIASIIKGFEYGPKRIGVKVLRTAYGMKEQLLDFLGME